MKELYCIACPTGCRLTVDEHEKELVVEGHECDLGYDFAVTEITSPARTLTTTVRTSFPGVPRLPVRTDGEIPKGKLMEAMEVLRGVVVSAELDCGDTVMEDLIDTGVRVVATSDILQRRELKNHKSLTSV